MTLIRLVGRQHLLWSTTCKKLGPDAPLLTVDAEGNPGVRQFTVPVSFTGFPAMSVPCGFSVTGLPIGLQIVANDFQERSMFRIAAASARATEFHKQRPPIYGKAKL